MLGMLIKLCVRGLSPVWRNSYAQYTVRNASSKQNGGQWREECVLGGVLPQNTSLKGGDQDTQYQKNP
jgi:hypothetical protein